MESSRKVVVTGIGVLSPIGLNGEELLSSLLSARSGIKRWESPYLDKAFPAALVDKDFSGEFTRLELPYLDRCSQLSVLAAKQAIEDAGLSSFAGYGVRAGAYLGTARGGTLSEEHWFEDFLLAKKQTAKPFAVFAIMHNAPTAHISIRHQILGPVMTQSSACTSSGCAIGDAYRAIRDGYLDVAVAGGAEAPITASVLGAWDGTRALATLDDDPGRSCRPFSANRSGLVMGEGAAFVILEAEEHARARGATIHAVLAGYGVASDGYHIGSPKAEGQTQAMLLALADASLSPAQIGYFNAHATGTRGGDTVEAKAIRAAFGACADDVPVSSTKSLHGHLLGAASALELIISIMAIKNSFLPATSFLDEIDESCNLRHIANTPQTGITLKTAMSFSSGLGGTNVALIVSAAETN